MRHAVDHRQDRGRRTDRGGELFHCLFERIGLHRQQNEVEGFADAVRPDGACRQGKIAMRAVDAQAVARQLSGAAWPHQERDVASGTLQAAAEISTQRARADHQYAHQDLSEAGFQDGVHVPVAQR